MDLDLKNSAVEFYKENMKLEEGKKNIYTVKSTDCRKFYKKHGITQEIMDKYASVEKALVNGANEVLTEKMVEAIADAKKAGEDPKDIKVTMKTSTYAGRNIQTIEAHRRYPSPRNPGQYIDCYGVVTLRVIQNKHLDKELMQAAEDAVKAAI